MSITKGELISFINDYPDDAEVIMEIRHNYDIPKSSGKSGWIAYINGIHFDEEKNVIKLMN